MALTCSDWMSSYEHDPSCISVCSILTCTSTLGSSDEPLNSRAHFIGQNTIRFDYYMYTSRYRNIPKFLRCWSSKAFFVSFINFSKRSISDNSWSRSFLCCLFSSFCWSCWCSCFWRKWQDHELLKLYHCTMSTNLVSLMLFNLGKKCQHACSLTFTYVRIIE